MEEKSYKCPHCPRSFPSEKALFGHLRTHPVIRSFPLTAPQATVGAFSTARLPPRRITLRERLEAYYHHWDTESYYEGDGGDYTKRYFDGLEREEKMQAGRIFSCQKRQDPLPAMKMKEENLTPARKDEEKVARRVTSSIVTLLTAPPVMAGMKRKNGEVADKIKDYECKICNDTFGSHQALGGHMTCHRSIIKTLPSSARDGKDASEPKTFVCKHCREVFATGQALGGHQRKHWPGPDATAGPSTIATNPSPAAKVSPSTTISDASSAPNRSVDPMSSSGVEEALSTASIDDEDSTDALDLDLRL